MSAKVRLAVKVVRKAATSKRHTKKKTKILSTAEKAVRRQAVVDRLILDHRENARKLARSLLRRWRVRMPAEETDSIVDLTLCEAARRYSSRRGASFMTFLFYHLRGNLVRSVATAAKSSNFLVSFARNAGVDVGDWATPQDPNFSFPEHAMFDSQESDLPDQLLIRREENELCRNACSQLDSLEQEVLTRSFANEEALIDIAKELGYSRCHISRVKKKALEQLGGSLSTVLGKKMVEQIEEERSHLRTFSEKVVRIQTLRKRRARRRLVMPHLEIVENGHTAKLAAA